MTDQHRGLKRKSEDTGPEPSASALHQHKKIKKDDLYNKMRKPLYKSQSRRPHPSAIAKRPQPHMRETVVAKPRFTKDLDFNFKDGDVTVVVGNRIFVVHRKKLELAGGVFTHLFESEFIKPDGGTRLPSVPLYDVSVADVRLLFAYLYGHIALVTRAPDGASGLHWAATMAIMRLTDRLQLNGLRPKIIEALELMLPTTGRPSAFRPKITGFKTAGDEKLFPRDFPFQLISLLRALDLPAMLPMAFYHACVLPLADIVDGSYRAGVLPNDHLAILEGRERLADARRRLFRWLQTRWEDPYSNKDGFTECQEFHAGSQNGHCWEFLYELDKTLKSDNDMADEICDPLEGVPAAVRDILRPRLCDACWDFAVRHMDSSLEVNWQSLPNLFRLPDWITLRKQQEEANNEWN